MRVRGGVARIGASFVLAAFFAASTTTATAQSCGGFRVLVFSKTSFQLRLISPATPRAVDSVR